MVVQISLHKSVARMAVILDDDIGRQSSRFGIRISELIRHLEFVIHHSHWSASMGSTFAARRAGRRQARADASSITTTTAPSDTGSVGAIPKSWFRRVVAIATALPRPMSNPIDTGRRPE